MEINSPALKSRPTSFDTKLTSFGGQLAASVAESPFVAIADVADVGLGAASTLSHMPGTAGDFIKGCTYAMGAYHAIKAVVHGITATESSESKLDVTKMTGEALISTGMFAAAAGVGPVSLGPLALGLTVANLANYGASS